MRINGRRVADEPDETNTAGYGAWALLAEKFAAWPFRLRAVVGVCAWIALTAVLGIVTLLLAAATSMASPTGEVPAALPSAMVLGLLGSLLAIWRQLVNLVRGHHRDGGTDFRGPFGTAYARLQSMEQDPDAQG